MACRAGVATLLSLLCLGSLLTAAHEVKSTHRFCPEHQSVEEDPDAVGLAAGGERPVLRSGPVASGEPSSAHGGCLLAQALASSLALSLLRAPGVPLPASEPEGRRLADGPPPSIALLFVAPKTSPPTLS